ncbi:MAG: N-acetyltransferase [Desulfobacterota bacterium]|nr:N-acetyltransferase [Thermodesulfobacteriota bacterium]
MVLRQEQEADFPAIYDLVKTAFQTAKVSNGDEQNFVTRLRAGGSYIPELALVAEAAGQLVGHIMLTRTSYTAASGPQPLLLLGPLAVILERRAQGLGGRLIQAALGRARAQGHKAVILVGDPAYYHRFGFKPAISFGIANTEGIPDENVMAWELIPGALDKPGEISFFS